MRLTRSRDDVMVSGLLAGIAEYFNFDPTIVRIVVVILFFAMTPFPVVPLYILGAIIVPKAPLENGRASSFKKNQRGTENKRSRINKGFKEFNQANKKSSSTQREIKEDDWSDF